jgi:cation diffusion facilitator family transporter
MATHHSALQRWQHGHDFLPDRSAAERSTGWVMLLTGVTMIVEIVAGFLSGSMALLADGWHMGTHVAAFGITIYAYRYARLHRNDPRFTFGTGKVTELGGFASALALAFVALLMLIESGQRLFEPRAIAFDEALAVAVLGLAVNVVSALILARQGGHGHAHAAAHDSPHDHDHAHDHDHDHDHDHAHAHGHGEDHNLRAAYLHVIADALTSVLAIVALLAGKLAGWTWLDPVMGIVGALLILRWAQGLARATAAVLLDGVARNEVRERLRSAIERHPDAARRGDSVADLHVWAVGPNRLAATVSVVADDPDTPVAYRRRLAGIAALAHIVVEVNRCDDPHCRKEQR